MQLGEPLCSETASPALRMQNLFIRRDGPMLVVASGRDISVASSIKRLAPENVFLVQVKLFTFFFIVHCNIYDFHVNVIIECY